MRVSKKFYNSEHPYHISHISTQDGTSVLGLTVALNDYVTANLRLINDYDDEDDEIMEGDHQTWRF